MYSCRNRPPLRSVGSKDSFAAGGQLYLGGLRGGAGGPVGPGGGNNRYYTQLPPQDFDGSALLVS